MVEGFFKRLFGKESTKDKAKRRLKLALIYDKLEVSDETLSNLQKDIIEVLSKYFVIEKDSLKLDIHRSEDYSSLVLNTPIVSAKHRGYST